MDIVKKENTDDVVEMMRLSVEATRTINDSMRMMQNNLSDIVEEQREVRKEIEELKYTSEITNAQTGEIKRLAKAKVRKLLGYPSYLYGTAMQDIYRYLREVYHMAWPIATTEKRFYKEILEGIERYETERFNEALIKLRWQKSYEEKMEGIKRAVE